MKHKIYRGYVTGSWRVMIGDWSPRCCEAIEQTGFPSQQLALAALELHVKRCHS